MANNPYVNKVVFGGQTVIDLSTDTVTSSDDILLGKVGHLRDGSVVTGTATGGGSGGGDVWQDAQGYVHLSNEGTEGGSMGDPVRFFDYDGTLLYSYSASDFQALTEMPSNPSHSGLTSQGWNWSLADAKTQLTAVGACDIGQMYVTDDGNTRLYCHFEKGRLAPYLGLCPNGTVTIDWGDNTATNTLTGTSLTSVKRVQHAYASAGDYVITLTATSGTFAFYGTSDGSYVFQKATTHSAYISNAYTNSIKKVELGTGAVLNNYAFDSCYSLASVTIPSTMTSIGAYAFYYCYALLSFTFPSGTTSISNRAVGYCPSLRLVSIPSGVTSVGTNAFYYCYALGKVVFPNGITNFSTNIFSACRSLANVNSPSSLTGIAANAFLNCSSLSTITIPSGVTSIAASAFGNCYSLAEIHFKPTTPPTVADANAFDNLQTDCKIYVPTGKLSAYTSAENYPSSATYTYIEE